MTQLLQILRHLPLACWLAAACLISMKVHAEPVLLAQTLELKHRPNFQVQDYLVSEKFDGIRAIWDGKTLRYRSGGAINAPTQFTQQLPRDTPLDGELWLGYRQFEALSATIRKVNPSVAAWADVQYHVFELPSAPGSFSERARKIEGIVALSLQQNPATVLRVVKQLRMPNLGALEQHLQSVLAKGGEGLMLHLASAPYITGRSDVLLKLKPWMDTEALVIGHSPGKGQFKGQLGALKMQLENGKRFSIGTGFSKHDRANPPPIGSLVTFRYRGFTAYGIPRFAVYLRVRVKE